MDNLEKNPTLPAMEAELAELQTKALATLKQISRDSQARANTQVTNSCKDSFSELEWKKHLEEAMPDLMKPTRAKSQELMALYEEERRLNLVMGQRRDESQKLLDVSVNAQWADIDASRRRATTLRQQYRQKRAEADKVAAAIQKDYDKFANRMETLTALLDEIKQRKARLQAKQIATKQESRRLDDELERLAGELNSLKTAYNAH